MMGGGELDSFDTGTGEPALEGGSQAMGFGGGGGTCQLQLKSTAWYYYNEDGNVTRVLSTLNTGICSTTNPCEFTATRMEYARNDRVVTYALGEKWTWSDGTSNPQGYLVTHAREFRYDGARERYLNVKYDAVAYQSAGQLDPLTETWTDYDGDEPYGDFTVTPGNPPTVTNLRSFELGVAVTDPFTTTGGAFTKYYHGDQIGTTRFLTNSTGGKIDADVYTAFGERVAGAASAAYDRYGYAGAYGYQAHTDFPFLHVGHRYYDPSTGRFLQRDPIGLQGGNNVYAYVHASPVTTVDPRGLQSASDVEACQDACDRWFSGGGVTCGPTSALSNCYNSCFKGFWPPGQGAPPKNFKPWPDTCPPCETGVPSPDRGRPSKPVKPPTNLPINPPTCGSGGGAAGLILSLGCLLLVRFSKSRWRLRAKPPGVLHC
jgi:RHS repeat-associated protein